MVAGRRSNALVTQKSDAWMGKEIHSLSMKTFTSGDWGEEGRGLADLGFNVWSDSRKMFEPIRKA